MNVKIWLRYLHFRSTRALLVREHQERSSKMEMQISQPDFDIDLFSIYHYELYEHPLNVRHFKYYNWAIEDDLFF